MPGRFKVSLSEDTGFLQELSISPVDGSVSETIYVRFEPDSLRTYSGSIVHSSTGLEAKYIAVSGTGAEIDEFPGTALEFDGTDDYINCGNENSFDVGNTLTVEAWIKPADLSFRQSIFSTRKNNDDGSFQLEVGAGNGGTNRIAVTGPGTWVVETEDNAISENEWNHIVYSRNGTGMGNHKIFVNGEEQQLLTENNYNFTDNDIDKLIGSKNGSTGFYSGILEEMRLWNIVRTEEEIRENMYIPLVGNETGLVSYWQFNE
ncbi:MAG TPA: LamG domain-containing protein, partial [Candidatus Cloacimonetes bacterium]|nr:LamG domain-containing protein [Candidatus Cloacimonadota bacterium]